MTWKRSSIKLRTVGTWLIFLSFSLLAVFVIVLVNNQQRKQALVEAEQKARIILDHNLATHTYFTKELKPPLLSLTAELASEDYFEPTWMSSTYANRAIHRYFRELNDTDYYYKEATVNARSPENEADAYERAFIQALNQNPDSTSVSEIRIYDGKPYFVTMRRSEELIEDCLLCHSDPEIAPQDLVSVYGDVRGFHREDQLGRTISAISIRVPLAEAYAQADRFSLRLSAWLLGALAIIFIVMLWVTNRLLFSPLEAVQQKALQISNGTEELGAQVETPFGKELAEFTSAFNTMSKSLAARSQQLRHTQEQLIRQERLAVLGQLAGSIGHELRNPLGVINNASYYLKMKLADADEDIRESIEMIDEETQSASKIIADLLDFGRIKASDRASVDVSELIAKVIEQNPAPENINISTTMAEDLPPVFIDGRQIMQVLTNLVMNGYQAMPEGGELSVESGPRTAGSVRIEVSDTGTGIPPENLEKIFEPLFTTKSRGIGLGLAISKMLVEANDGRIEVESRVGEGTTFRVVLPIVREQ